MLGEAVAEARGEAPDIEQSEVTINLPADFYLAEEYIPDVDRRVLAYRRLATATELAEVDELEHELAEKCGALPLAAKNLMDRARLRVRAQRLGVTSVSLTDGRIVYQGIELTRDASLKLREQGAVCYPKTHKVVYPFSRRHTGYAGGRASARPARSMEELLPCALGVLETCGGDDESDE